MTDPNSKSKAKNATYTTGATSTTKTKSKTNAGATSTIKTNRAGAPLTGAVLRPGVIPEELRVGTDAERL